MNKSARMEAFIGSLGTSASDPAGRCYLGYFQCFNRGEYYEAHDVLEHLWLQSAGPDHQFYKGLIQLAGAFVHLKLHHLHPSHRVHGRRLHPAARLFRLASSNLSPFAPVHHELTVNTAIGLARSLEAQIQSSGFSCNPWSPASLPQITLLPGKARQDDGADPENSSPADNAQNA